MHRAATLVCVHASVSERVRASNDGRAWACVGAHGRACVCARGRVRACGGVRAWRACARVCSWVPGGTLELMESCVRLYREGATACASGQRRREEGEEGMAAPMRSQWRAVLAFMASFASFGRVRRARARTRALGACARVVGSEMRNAALRRRSGGDGGGGNRHRTCDEKGAMGREGRVHNGARLMAERMCWRRHRLESSGALVSGGRLHNACSVAGQCPIAFSRRRSSRLRGVLSTAAGLRRVEWAAAGRPESARVRESDAGHLRPSAGQRSQSDVPV